MKRLFKGIKRFLSEFALLLLVFSFYRGIMKLFYNHCLYLMVSETDLQWNVHVFNVHPETLNLDKKIVL